LILGLSVEEVATGQISKLWEIEQELVVLKAV
jgi:hypothetical protein